MHGGLRGDGVRGVPTRSTALALSIARRYSESNMSATVRLTRMAAPFPDADGTSEAIVEEVIYLGKGRLYSVQGPMTMGLGDFPSFYSTTFLSVPMGAAAMVSDPVINDMVELLSSPDEIVNFRFFRVTGVDAGGMLPVVHRLHLVGYETQNRPPDIVPAEWLI